MTNDLATVRLQATTLGDLLLMAADAEPDRTAVILPDPSVPDFGPEVGKYTGIAMRSGDDATRFIRVKKGDELFNNIVLLHGDRADKSQTPKDIVPSIFLETYQHQDGRALTQADIDALPVVNI